MTNINAARAKNAIIAMHVLRQRARESHLHSQQQSVQSLNRPQHLPQQVSRLQHQVSSLPSSCFWSWSSTIVLGSCTIIGPGGV